MEGRRGLVVVGLTVAMLVAVAPGAQAAPVRSGTIVGGLHTTAPSHSCALIPDCAAWLHSGCSSALAGRNPAWLASIEKVSDLAGSERVFRYRGEVFSTVFIQFWTGGCREMGQSRRASSEVWDTGWQKTRNGLGWYTSLSIPSGAKWMTVVANAGVATRWTLT